ncbi:MAG: PLAT/LH2 domain-containing protein [Caldilineaceae bacterium]
MASHTSLFRAVNYGVYPGVFLLVLLFCAGCSDPTGLGDPIKQAVAVLDNGIERLGSESADWRRVLEETRDKLPSEIRDDVNTVLSRAIETTGVEFRCGGVDFVRTRVRQDLIRIRADLLKQTIPAKEPTFCHVDPPAVDTSRLPPWINIIGYDFDTTPIQVILHYGDQYQDVSEFLQKPTHYHMTLNLGENGVRLLPFSSEFILKWNNRVISTIGISLISTPAPISIPLPTTYEITVITGNRDGAGTDANVFIDLYGTKSQILRKELDTRDHNDFERGHTDIFRITVPNAIGNLQQIHIGHDNSGKASGWFLSAVSVKNLRTGENWDFPCNRWFAVDEEDRQIYRDIFPGGPCK